MDINGNVDAEQRNIEIYPKHGKINQQWDLVYADEWKGEPGPGEMNEDFGLRVMKTFYIVSKLPSGRYLDIIDHKKFALKTRNSLISQKWYFEQASLTIKSRINNLAWDIEGSGGSSNMRIYQPNSGWW